MKKFTTIVMTCLIMLVAVLTGCSTFKVDKVKYYNEVLAKVGDECITRFDLLNAYSSYGHNAYVTQQGQSEQQALVSTMNLLVQRELTAQYAMDNPNRYSLTAYEVNKVYRDTIDSLMSGISSNMKTARKIYNLKAKEKADATEDSKELHKLSEYDYEKRVKLVDVAEVVDGQTITYKQIQYINTDPELDKEKIDPVLDEIYINNHKDYTQTQIVNKLFDKFMEELRENKDDEDAVLYQKVCNKALELTCDNLVNYEYYLRQNGKRLSINQRDLLYRFVERSYESQLQNAYITKVNTVYLQTETLSNQSVINAFKAMYENDYAKYVGDQSAYNENIIKTDADLIYYHPNGDDEFGYFLHVLLPFNNIEDDLNWLKDHKNDYNYTAKQYRNLQIAKIEGEMMCAQRTTKEVRDDNDEVLYEEGETLEAEVPFLEVLAEYEQKVKDLASFKEFMFKYTTDNATLSADMPYVIGYNVNDYTGKIEDGKVVGAHSSMVVNFTAEAIRLMVENQTYTGSKEYIITNYGVHLLYYMGPVVNTISVEDIDKLTVEKLNSMVLNQATGETYLDRVFDLVYPAGGDGMFTSNTKYSTYEQTLIDTLYAQYPVTLYETKIKASNKI